MSQNPTVGRVVLTVNFAMNEGWNGDTVLVGNNLAALLRNVGFDVQGEPEVAASDKPQDFRVTVSIVQPAEQLLLWIAVLTIRAYSCASGAIKGHQGIVYLSVMYQ